MGVLVALAMAAPGMSVADECAELFLIRSATGAISTPTERLISYLSQLLENNGIGERELVTLREGANPIPHKQIEYGPVFETSARRIQYQVVQAHMQSGSLDKARINAWVDQKLQENSKVRVQRQEVREETKSPFREMEFHRLPPGEFEMGEFGKQVPVKLTHPIEMMSTLITQRMWVEVMGENPSHFKDGPESVEIEIDGKVVRMQPDHPVENISWWSVVVFANRLSEQRGFKPAYDLSEVETKGRAENGTLEAIKGDFKMAAPEGDIYQAEGFRLPTEAEQEYVLRNLGRAKGKYPFDLTEAELGDYSWFGRNSGDTTHAVGSTPKSLSIDGKTFDDLIGNVAEWSHDYIRTIIDGGTNPIATLEPKLRGLRGGNFRTRFDHQLTSGRAGEILFEYSFVNKGSLGHGARLVRTVK